MKSAYLMKECVEVNKGNVRDEYYSYSCSQYVDASVVAGCVLGVLADFLEERLPSIERSGQRDMAKELQKKREWIKWIRDKITDMPEEPPAEGTIPYNFSSFYFYGCLATYCAGDYASKRV